LKSRVIFTAGLSLVRAVMKKIVVRKEAHEGTVIITFRFKALGQLLDLDDPTPLPKKEMTEEAEDTIFGHLDEYRVGRSASLVLELPEEDLDSTASSLIPDVVRHHFGFRQSDLTHDLKISQREGIYSLFIALGNAAFLIWILFSITRNEIIIDAVKGTLFLGFLTILNWVTIWDTYEHFVYDYRNLFRKRRIYRKITTIPVEVKGY
jgi:hypothetical protein